MLNIENLNKNQNKAVNHISGPCMVLAGPGSGKTRVITYRIINMIQNKSINPGHILAITFTKASATEMKERALKLSSDYGINKVTFGTFHSVFFRILRHFKKYNLDYILNEKDKKFIIKNILKTLKIDNGEDDDTISGIINDISYLKNELMEAVDFNSNTLSNEEFKNVYRMYEEYKEQMNKIDFDDMLIHTYHLLNNNASALNTVRNRYKYILVDEFQDINKVQFEILKLISSPNNNIFVVGDEDQSIYGFRGARPDFLLQFEEYFPNVVKIVLDVNYRSTKNIISSANKLIKNNSNRYDKIIKPNREDISSDVNFMYPEDSEDEASKIGKDIAKKINENNLNYSDFAVIYRTNIQSRALIDVFMDMSIPFVVRDTVVTIYDHWVCQDILSYLRLSLDVNLKNEWIRIINRPFRYISKDSIKMASDESNFINTLKEKCDLHYKQLQTIEDLEMDLGYISGLSPKNAISYIRTSLEYDRYIVEYCSNRKLKANGLFEILNEIESSAVHFKTVKDYLDHIQKVKEEMVYAKKDVIKDGVVFTTMHSAKGLEFKNVYIVGTTEGTIPHEKSYDIEDESQKLQAIEEERRLLYVGITRAMNNLYISIPKQKYNKAVFKSRFIDEIKGIKKKDLNKIKVKQDESMINTDVNTGDKIYHKKFEEGLILDKEDGRISVEFKAGIKLLDYITCLKNGIIKKISK
jgi:DNA helicase II / ATP-dependent DNA helicase PcrA